MKDPGQFRKETLRTKRVGRHRVIVGQRKTTGKWEAQAVLHPKDEGNPHDREHNVLMSVVKPSSTMFDLLGSG